MATYPTDELEGYIHAATERHASEVFLIPGEPVSYRVRGEIQRDDGDVLTAEQVRALAASIVGEAALAKIATTTGEQTTSCHVPGVFNAQITVAKACGDFTVAVQVLPTKTLTVEDVGLPQAAIDAYDARYGLALFGGPVGSGKTTTCYAVLDDINARRPVHICTVEDPVMLRLTPKKAVIQQRGVGVDVPDTISGIRAALRQGFDVLFVSEARTPEEVQAYVTAAETFAMVITQIHARSPQATIQRLIDVQPDETRAAFCKALADALRVACVQWLLPCAKRPGRVAAYGVLVPDDELRAAIAGGGDLLSRTTPLPPGCQTLQEHIGQLVSEGTVSEEDAAEVLAQI